jgi:AcrR family transcriptional regulator
MPKKKKPDTILPVPLSRERVLLAAIGLGDAEGLEALSMRNLAQELGVRAMSLYNHVKIESAAQALWAMPTLRKLRLMALVQDLSDPVA